MSKCIDHGKKGNSKGYSADYWQGNFLGSHRRAYCEANNVSAQSIKGLVVRHTCDNPRCINPKHLLVGTYQDNTNDMLQRKRQAVGVNSGTSKLREQDVLYIRENYKFRSKDNSQVALAAKFGVSQSVVSRILDGTTWQYLEKLNV